MIVRLLAEHHLELLSCKGGCRGSSDSTLVKMSNCWKSHALAHYYILVLLNPDLSCFENTEDPDQLATEEAI